MSHEITAFNQFRLTFVADEIALAEQIVCTILQASRAVTEARRSVPLAFPIVPADADESYWSRLILAGLLDAGWAPPFGVLGCGAPGE